MLKSYNIFILQLPVALYSEKNPRQYFLITECGNLWIQYYFGILYIYSVLIVRVTGYGIVEYIVPISNENIDNKLYVPRQRKKQKDSEDTLLLK